MAKPDPTKAYARARANTERTAPHLLTPAPVPTAELLARLNAVGVEVRTGFAYLAKHGRAFAWMYAREATGPCEDFDARNAVTVAALEVVREGANGDDDDRGEQATGEWIDLSSAPDLATAAVDAAVRVKEAAR